MTEKLREQKTLREEIAIYLFCEFYSSKGMKLAWDRQFMVIKKTFYKQADAILLKCHQSDEIVDNKEARIKELEKINRNNQELVTVMSEQIHELEKYKQPEYEKAILQQARADERKKIGEWLNNHATDEIGGILLLPDELAKFQNCEITK
jgi:hypothetical protein